MDVPVRRRISAAKLLVAAAGFTLGIVGALAVRDAAEPCAGRLMPVAYDPPPGGVGTLAPSATIVYATTPNGRSDDFIHTEVTTRLGNFGVTFSVLDDRLGSYWETETMRDSSLCPDSEIRVHMPERSYGCPKMSLYYDQERDIYVVTYDNTTQLEMGFPGYGERVPYHDAIVAAFRRDTRPIRFYPTTRRIVGGIAYTLLAAGWLVVLLHLRRARG